MEVVYVYDGSFSGFLSCIFAVYAHHEPPYAIVPEATYTPTLFETRFIPTDEAYAQRVLHKIAQNAPHAANLLQRGFLTCLPEREMHLYRLVAKLLRDGPWFLQNLADDTLLPVLKAVRHLEGEVQLLRGFVRFSEHAGVLGAEIEPKNHVLPLLRPHFCGRFPDESFFIYDRTHQEALFHAGRETVIAPLAHFEMAPPDEAEAAYRCLWKRFYDTIAIKERENPRCRMTQMPKRYWHTMTEFQGPDHFIPQRRAAAVPAPGVPDGKSAPETP